jgi:Protein of unknown function (DUF2851)
MTEALLQYLWQLQQFNAEKLRTTDGESLLILQPGTLNHNQGPDFLQAKIRVGNTILVGHIELHIRASGWLQHGHARDPHYQNIILHVVWQEDKVLRLPFPVLVLEDRVPKWWLDKYREWMTASRFIPCENRMTQLPALHFTGWKERLLIERLQHKVTDFNRLLSIQKRHWEAAFWQLVARGFGGKVNGAAFEEVLASIPYALLWRHHPQLHQIEALLLGQAGLLEETITDPYALILLKEYRFLAYKYKLRPIRHTVLRSRMRPAAFPVIRLAQLAMLWHTHPDLPNLVKEADSANDIRAFLNLTAGEYWNNRYHFDAPSIHRPKRLGATLTDHLLINVVIPFLFAWGQDHQLADYKEKGLTWLMAVPAEMNQLVRRFAAIGVHCQSAADSQAVLQLHSAYCSLKLLKEDLPGQPEVTVSD